MHQLRCTQREHDVVHGWGLLADAEHLSPDALLMEQ